MDWLNFVLPFFITPQTYDQVLRKIAGSVFYVTYLATLFLREIPQVETIFHQGETYGPIGRIVQIIPHWEVLNIGGAMLAFAMAALSYAFKLHDRISDLTGIRREFDTNHILFPLAQAVGITLTPEQKVRAYQRRHALMREVFYKYTSSRADGKIVDRHDIEHAPSAWAWLWILLESITILLVAILVALVLGDVGIASSFAVVAVIGLLLVFLLRGRLVHHAQAEIDQIAANSRAAAAVRAALNAL